MSTKIKDHQVGRWALTTSGTATLTYAGTGRTVTTDGTSTYSYTPGGTPLGVKQGATASIAVTDLHTDLTALLNPATGALAGSRSYSPFGQVTATAGTQTALEYQDQYTDPGSGNVNMGARWYLPSTGGFASRDTIGLDPRDTANANRHAYAGGTPLTSTDPTGHWGTSGGPVTITGGAVGTAAGGGAIFILGGVAVVAGGAVLLSFLFSGTAANDEMTPAQTRANAINIVANDPYGSGRWPSYDQELKQFRNLRGGGGSGPPPVTCSSRCGPILPPHPIGGGKSGGLRPESASSVLS